MHERPDDYLSDTTYPDRFHRELSPTWLNYVAAQAGTPPVGLERPFTYLDLGCGFAHSTIVNAAVFPHAEFHACDFNPAHIQAAKRHAARLGVGNVRFHQAYFEELLERGMPELDFIVAHGVYSWVSPAVCETVQRIVAQKLRPGGLVYLSYNCLPGWSSEIPLRRLLLELAAHQTGGSEQRTQAALVPLQQLSTNSFKYFRDNPAALAAVEAFKHEPTNYLAHEFLNGSWALYYSIDVAQDMAKAGVTYLGSATLTDNHPMLLLDATAAEVIARLPTPQLRQLGMDFAVNQRFRRDVFLKGEVAATTPAAALDLLDEVVIGCITDVDQIRAQATIPRGKISFNPQFIEGLRACMQLGPTPLREAIRHLSGPGHDALEIRRNLLFLIAAGTLAPFARAASVDDGRRRHVEPMVQNALEYIADTGKAAAVPCKALGSGIMVGQDEAKQALKSLAERAGDDLRPSRLRRLGLLG